MKRALTLIGTAALLGGSLLLGTGPALASTCPAGQHWNAMGGGAGFCAPDASGGGTGGDATIDLGGSTPSYGQPQAPAFQAPNTYQPPVYRAPAGNAPVRGTTPRVQAPPAQRHMPAAPAQARVPAQQRHYAAAPGAVTAPKIARTTPSVASPGSAANPEIPAGKPAIVMPKTEAQAVASLRSAIASAAEKTAALAIVKAKVESVLDRALSRR